MKKLLICLMLLGACGKVEAAYVSGEIILSNFRTNFIEQQFGAADFGPEFDDDRNETSGHASILKNNGTITLKTESDDGRFEGRARYTDFSWMLGGHPISNFEAWVDYEIFTELDTSNDKNERVWSSGSGDETYIGVVLYAFNLGQYPVRRPNQMLTSTQDGTFMPGKGTLHISLPFEQWDIGYIGLDASLYSTTEYRTPVPEPMSLSLFGIGLLGLVKRKWLP